MSFFKNIFQKLQMATKEKVVINKQTKSLDLLISIKNDQYFTLNFDNMHIQYPNDPCVLKTNLIYGINKDLGSLYIEIIKLKPRYEWKMSGESVFDIFIKNEFYSYDFEYMGSYEEKFYKFTRYNLDQDQNIGLIWFCLNDQDIFILDQKGKLFNDLLKIHDIKDSRVYMNINTLETLEIKDSITSLNMIEDFFGKKS